LGRTLARIKQLHINALTILIWSCKRGETICEALAWIDACMGEVNFDIIISRVMVQKGPSPRRLVFDSRPVLVGYVVETLAMEHGFYRIAFRLPVFTNAPFSLTRRYVHTCFHSFTHSFVHSFIANTRAMYIELILLLILCGDMFNSDTIGRRNESDIYEKMLGGVVKPKLSTKRLSSVFYTV
jgi:hypothetical protein